MTSYPKQRAEIAQPQDQSIRYIALTKGQIAIVDAADYAWLSERPWYALDRNCGVGFYAVTRIKTKTIYMHRYILGLTGKIQADHANRNTLDNRRSNLRPATASQNRCNVRKFNPSGYKGVRWHVGKWVASITVKGIPVHLGRFTDKHDAARAYNEAAQKHEGEFAYLNEVPNV
jgi:hypothetical protein